MRPATWSHLRRRRRRWRARALLAISCCAPAFALVGLGYPLLAVAAALAAGSGAMLAVHYWLPYAPVPRRRWRFDDDPLARTAVLQRLQPLTPRRAPATRLHDERPMLWERPKTRRLS
jgi:hypothetical protein